MNNSVWKKGLVIGIIMLFFGVGVFPSVCGIEVIRYIEDNTVNNSTVTVTFIIISLINQKDKIDENYYVFNNLIGYIMVFYDGKFSSDSTPMIGWPIGFAYGSKIGIFNEHLVCAIFFNCYFPYAS